jgi:hypothetical protein
MRFYAMVCRLSDKFNVLPFFIWNQYLNHCTNSKFWHISQTMDFTISYKFCLYLLHPYYVFHNAYLSHKIFARKCVLAVQPKVYFQKRSKCYLLNILWMWLTVFFCGWAFCTHLMSSRHPQGSRTCQVIRAKYFTPRIRVR